MVPLLEKPASAGQEAFSFIIIIIIYGNKYQTLAISKFNNWSGRILMINN
jgi:hypothetical protein